MKLALMIFCISCALSAAMDAAASDPATEAAQLSTPPQLDLTAGEEAAFDSRQTAPLAPSHHLSSREFRYTATPRLDPLYLDFLALFTYSETLEGNSSAALRLPLNAQVGVQWNLDGQRPSLDYRFSSNTVVRLRGSRHGARLVLQAKF